MLDVLALALIISVFGGTVTHILSTQLGTANAAGGAKGFTAARLRRVEKPVDSEEVPGPTWASFPRAF